MPTRDPRRMKVSGNLRPGAATHALISRAGDWSFSDPEILNLCGCYSGNSSPDPPASAGKSLNLGSPSLILSTVS